MEIKKATEAVSSGNPTMAQLEAINAQFSPIENYDRYEEYKDNETSGNTRTNDLTTTNNLTSTNDLTDTHDMTDTNDVSAFDATGYQAKDKQHTGGTIKNTGTVKDTGNVKNTGTVEDEASRKLTHEAHIHGNIGVVRSSQMIDEYIGLYDKQNIYQLIATDFITRFLIMVY